MAAVKLNLPLLLQPVVTGIAPGLYLTELGTVVSVEQYTGECVLQGLTYVYYSEDGRPRRRLDLYTGPTGMRESRPFSRSGQTWVPMQ